MCFNISLLSLPDWKAPLFEVNFRDNALFRQLYHAFAFSNPIHPIMCNDKPGSYVLAHWGLVPSWVKDQDKAGKILKYTYNARSETIFTKPSFRGSIKEKRALIPVTGFFEYHEHKGKKYPYHIRMKDSRPFHLAGIWEESDLLTGTPERTFSIVTCEANPLMAMVHNTKKRMPVILEEKAEKVWLDPGTDEERMKEVMVPYKHDDLIAYPVTRIISSRGSKTNVPEILEPTTYNELNDAVLDQFN